MSIFWDSILRQHLLLCRRCRALDHAAISIPSKKSPKAFICSTVDSGTLFVFKAVFYTDIAFAITLGTKLVRDLACILFDNDQKWRENHTHVIVIVIVILRTKVYFLYVELQLIWINKYFFKSLSPSKNESHFKNDLVPFSLIVSRISVELELKLIKCVFIYINIFNNLDFVSKFVFHLRLVAWAFHKIFYNSPLPLHPLLPATFLLAARFAFGDLFNLVYCINLCCFDQHF